MLGAGRIGQRRLERLEREANRYSRLYPLSTPGQIGLGVRDHYRAASQALKQAQSGEHRTRLLATAGRFAALMSWLCYDTKQPAAALDHLDEGLEAAEQAGDRVLSAYVLASRGRVATFEGDHKEIRDVGLAAINRAGTGRHVSGRMLAWLYTLEARGHAGMGDLAATERALAQAERALGEGGRAEPGPDMDFFDFTRLRALAGECYVFLRKPRLARTNLEETLQLIQPEQRKRRAMVELDLARAYVQAGQVAEACALAEQALNLGDESFVGPLAQRVRDLQAEIAARR